MIYGHKIVNDLAWVIGSVPLMSYFPSKEMYRKLDSEWFKNEEIRCQEFLQRTDQSPEDLIEFVSENGRRQLLGKRFEKLTEFWLRHSGKFEIILSNHQIKSSNETVGEVDYLVRDVLSDEVLHLEVACKYYLGYNNSSLWKNWKGLNARDNLEDKMTKFEKQLRVFQTDEGKKILSEKRVQLPDPHLIMKGYFFHHWKSVVRHKSPKLSTDSHNSGVFLKLKEADQFFNGHNTWVVLRKKDWFSGFHTRLLDEVSSEFEIRREIRDLIHEYKTSVMLARLIERGGVLYEDLRVVVVYDSWPNKA